MRKAILGSLVLGLAFSNTARAEEIPTSTPTSTPTPTPDPSSTVERDAPPPPPPPPAGRRSEWGAQIRLERAAMGREASSNASMGGLGLGVRPRLTPRFAIDLGIDFLRGQDFYGEERSETAFFINPVFFVNPRNR